MRGRNRLMRTLGALVTVCALVLGPTAAASADPAFDDSSYSQAQRDAAEQKGLAAAAAAVCGSLGVTGAAATLCATAVSGALTAEALADLTIGTVCGWVRGVPGVGDACESVVNVDLVQTAFTTAYQAALLAAGSAVTGVQLVADASTAFDMWANDRWADAVGLFQDVLADAAAATEFHADRVWWRDAYTATAGLGLLVLAVMLLVTYRAASSGKVSTEELGQSFSTYVPLFVVFAVFGPPLAYVLSRVQSGLSSSFLEWQFGDLQRFLESSSVFTQLTSAMPGGTGMGLLLALMLFITAGGLLFTLVMQTISLYILGAIVPIAAAMLVHPRWRRKGVGLLLAWLGLLLARPALFLVMGIVLRFENAQIAEAGAAASQGDTVDALVAAFIVVAGLGMVALAPWALLRFFPLLPEGGDSVRSAGGGQVSGAVAGAAASGAIQAGMNRARNNSSAERGGGVPSGSPTRSHASGGGSGSGAGGLGPTGGRPGSSGSSSSSAARSGGRHGLMSRSSRSGGGAGSGGTVSAGASAARSGGGGVARAAGGASRVASGGALFAAHVGLSAAQAGLQKAREAADAGAPEVREVMD